MATKKTNTTKTIDEGKQVTEKELTAQIKAAGDVFAKQPKVKVSIPKGLKKNIGDTLPIGINGSFLVIPVDGESYEIPESFAEHLNDYLKTLRT